MPKTSRKMNKREREDLGRAQLFFQRLEAEKAAKQQAEIRSTNVSPPAKKARRKVKAASLSGTRKTKRAVQPASRKPPVKRKHGESAPTDQEPLAQKIAAKKPKTEVHDDDSDVVSIAFDMYVKVKRDADDDREDVVPSKVMSPVLVHAPDPPVVTSPVSRPTAAAVPKPRITVPSRETVPSPPIRRRVSVPKQPLPTAPSVPRSPLVYQYADDFSAGNYYEEEPDFVEKASKTSGWMIVFRVLLFSLFFFAVGVLSTSKVETWSLPTASAFSKLILPTANVFSKLSLPTAIDFSSWNTKFSRPTWRIKLGSTRKPTCFADAGIDSHPVYGETTPPHCVGAVRPRCPGAVCQRGTLVSCGPYAKPTQRNTKCTLTPHASQLASKMYEILRTSTMHCRVNDLHCQHPFFAGLDYFDNRPLFYFDKIAQSTGAGGTHASILDDLNRYNRKPLFSIGYDATTEQVVVGVHPTIPRPMRSSDRALCWTWSLLKSIGMALFRVVRWLCLGYMACFTVLPWITAIVSLCALLYAALRLYQHRLANLLPQVSHYRQCALEEVYRSDNRCANPDQVLARIAWDLHPASNRKREDFANGIWLRVVEDIESDSRVEKMLVRDKDGNTVTQWTWLDSLAP